MRSLRLMIALHASVAVLGNFEVVSYNLYWWNVGQNNRWQALYDNIEAQNFDLIGFQECENVDQVVASVPRMNGRFDTYAPTEIPGPGDNPAPVAWDSQRFDKLDAGWMEIGSDQYGKRVTVWVRLRDLQNAGSTVFFANTHGPLGDCSRARGDDWQRAVTNNIVAGDMLLYTGDFNCGAGSAAINVLDDARGGAFKLVANGGIDLIFTNGGAELASWRSVGGYPSDHPLITASFEGPTVPSLSPPPSPPSPPSPPPPPPKCGLSSCTGTVLATSAESSTCANRIDWVAANMAGYTELEACQLVAEEYPAECGPCAPQGLAPSPPPSPSLPAGASVALEVVTYNLYWWNVAQNNRWQALYDNIEAHSFELIGFQVNSEDYVSSESWVPLPITPCPAI